MLSRGQIIGLACREDGFVVHLYKYRDERNRKLCSKMQKEGLLYVVKGNKQLFYFATERAKEKQRLWLESRREADQKLVEQFINNS